MYEHLLKLEREERPIRVAILGAGGSMGQGIALQLGITPGFRLVAAIDLDLERAEDAARLHGRPWTRAQSESDLRTALAAGKTVVGDDASAVLALGPEFIDVLVESTSTVGVAGRAAEAALRAGIDVVLMNAEVDCLLGPRLHRIAREVGAVITSDAGDQHGVLMRMIDEVRVWGFEVVIAGNIKGFLDRCATPASIAEEARKRNLSPIMCTAYTDGTKLNIEMALVANATGLLPARRGMLGPRAGDVSEVFSRFDLEGLRGPGAVDYILGAEPGGGVFVVGYCDQPVQRDYLSYYKMGGGPFYLFYRPYHLCHIETTYALARVAIERKPLFTPLDKPVAEVVAIAKRDLPAGTTLEHGIGGFDLYGEIDRRSDARAAGAIPICLLDREEGPLQLTRAVSQDQPLVWDDLELAQGQLLDAYRAQERLLETAR